MMVPTPNRVEGEDPMTETVVDQCGRVLIHEAIQGECGVEEWSDRCGRKGVRHLIELERKNTSKPSLGVRLACVR